MRIITTVHKEGFDQYGEKWLKGLDLWPAEDEFIAYTEGFDLDHPRVTGRRIESVVRAEAFKVQFRHYKPVNWRWDIVRFGNKVFSSYDALYDYKGIAVWMDADAETYAKMPEGYVRKMLPEGNYLALFKRQGMPPETGFWVMDCSHPAHQQFLDTWIRWLESGAFKQLSQWCDASTMEATIRQFEKAGAIQTASLSEGFEKEHHPMAMADIGKYIDHRKGGRKGQLSSPENPYRKVTR